MDNYIKTKIIFFLFNIGTGLLSFDTNTFPFFSLLIKCFFSSHSISYLLLYIICLIQQSHEGMADMAVSRFNVSLLLSFNFLSLSNISFNPFHKKSIVTPRQTAEIINGEVNREPIDRLSTLYPSVFPFDSVIIISVSFSLDSSLAGLSLYLFSSLFFGASHWLTLD